MKMQYSCSANDRAAEECQPYAKGQIKAGLNGYSTSCPSCGEFPVCFCQDGAYDHSGEVSRVHAEAPVGAPDSILQTQGKRQADKEQSIGGFQMRGQGEISEDHKHDLDSHHFGKQILRTVFRQIVFQRCGDCDSDQETSYAGDPNEESLPVVAGRTNC